MKSRHAVLAASIVALTACADDPTGAVALPTTVTANETSEVGSSVRWNRKAMALFRARGGSAGRPNAYLSLAQYLAVLAAEVARETTEDDADPLSETDISRTKTRPSLAGAAAGASGVVLMKFYPLDSAAIDAELALQRSELPQDGDHKMEFAAGEAVGRDVGAEVLARAATDNFGLTSPGLPPVGPGYWVSSGAPIVRGGLGARPFFLTSGSELRAPPPPAYGSTNFLAALAEVRAIADARTADQVAIAQKWVPFSGVVLNGVATDLIVRYRRSEQEAARILAYANLAAFDAIIGCFDTKFAYWFIRPTQADPLITLAVGLPNHPSYPSAHSCETGAWHGILTDAFPAERTMLDDLAHEASISRVYGGIHYRFDGDAGLELGRSAARLALRRLRFDHRLPVD